MTDDRHDDPGEKRPATHRPRPRSSAPWRDPEPVRPRVPQRLVEPGVFDLSAEVELGEDGYFHLRKPGTPPTDGNPGSE